MKSMGEKKRLAEQQQQLSCIEKGKTTGAEGTSVLPIIEGIQNNNKADALIEDYLLHNLTNPQTLILNSGVASIQYSTNSTYIGQLRWSEAGNHKQGRGVYKYSNEDVYLGDWRNDSFHGVGIYIFANGDIYRGFFQFGSPTTGLMIYHNGDFYEGTFKDGYRDGHGIMKWGKKVDGNNQLEWQQVYQGSWRKNARSGKGIFKCKKFELNGTWENDQLNGEVVLSQFEPEETSLSQYSGFMTKNKLISGKCKIRYSENSSYEGEVSNGKFEGVGRLFQHSTSNEKFEYSGHFKQGLASGRGKLKISKKGPLSTQFVCLYEGDANKNKAEGVGRIIYWNGDVYEGSLALGYKQGFGRYIFKNGDIYEGFFQNDNMQGRGRYIWRNMSLCYNGQFKNNKIEERKERLRGQKRMDPKEEAWQSLNRTSQK